MINSILKPSNKNLLTSFALFAKLNFLNLMRHDYRLFQSQAENKNSFFCICQFTTSLFSGKYILAVQRLVSVRTGGFIKAGERCAAFLYLNPKLNEVSYD